MVRRKMCVQAKSSECVLEVRLNFNQKKKLFLIEIKFLIRI